MRALVVLVLLAGIANADPITGTWTRQIGQRTVYMRFDDHHGYKMWSPEMTGSSNGEYVINGGKLTITKTEDHKLVARFEVHGDTLVLVKDDGTSDSWTRAKSPPPPNEASLAGPDGKDPKRAFDEGVRLYNAGDKKTALVWFKRAAELGNVSAYVQVGWHYEMGAGTKHDFAAAVAWYRKAADAGHGLGLKNLGHMYEIGTGVKEDWVEAARLYKLSAQKGEVRGQVAYADAFRFGIGVAQDRNTAIEWYKRAAAQGDANAADAARLLHDPTNNVGFRDDGERDLVIGNKLRFSGVLFGADPAGRLFHNAAERRKWLVTLRDAADADEAEALRRDHDRMERHWHKVNELEGQGYSHERAEREAGY